MPDVTVIDYGVGNLYSVRSALENCGATVNVTSDHGEILGARRVVLPGVGAFGDAMQELRTRGLVGVIRDVAKREIPLLGICLGMQLLLDESEEFGINAGLGLIPGRVIPVPSRDVEGAEQKIPHIGWSALRLAEETRSWAGTYLSEVILGEAVYFVHSFMAVPSDPSHRLADCSYGGQRLPAVIARGGVLGCQFHPERSGEVGLKILRSFCGVPESDRAAVDRA
jgi:glutamine amidotransferase